MKIIESGRDSKILLRHVGLGITFRCGVANPEQLFVRVKESGEPCPVGLGYTLVLGLSTWTLHQEELDARVTVVGDVEVAS